MAKWPIDKLARLESKIVAIVVIAETMPITAEKTASTL